MAFFDFLNSPEGRQAAAGALMDVGNIWTRSGPGGAAPHGLVPGGNLQRAFMRNAENARHAQRVQAQQALTQGRQKWGMSPTFVKDRTTGEYLPVQFSNYGGAQIPGVGPVDPEKHEFVLPYSYEDLGYGVGAYPYGAGQPEGVAPKGPPPETQPKYKEAQARATAAGSAIGTAAIDAEMSFPQVEANTTELIGLLDQLTAHPGMPYAVGASSMLPVPPGTPAADFMGLYDQIIGKNFMQAYETLKGGGQITEIEGKKATDAMARMARRQSEAGFISAAKEFRSILQRGLERKRLQMKQLQGRQQTGTSGKPGAAPPRQPFTITWEE